MKLTFRHTALNDLRWFQVYYGEVFPEGRRRAERRYAASVKAIRVNPHIGRKLQNLGAREFPILGTPFLIIYRIGQTEIEVLHIWDGRSDRSRLVGGTEEENQS
jgi:plasmid stabilization system protein ParE